MALAAMLKPGNYLLQALLFCLPSRDCCQSSNWSAGKPHECFHAVAGNATGSWEGSGCVPCRHLYDRKLGRTSRSVTSYLPKERSQRDLELLRNIRQGFWAADTLRRWQPSRYHEQHTHRSGTEPALMSALGVWQSLPGTYALLGYLGKLPWMELRGAPFDLQKVLRQTIGLVRKSSLPWLHRIVWV